MNGQRLRRLCAALFAANCLLRFLLALTLPLSYKEAYYWEWSLFPSMGYLDHPPLVAWVIRIFGEVFPERSVLGIRCGALLFGTGAFLLVHRLAGRLFADRDVASTALLIAMCLPMVNAMGVFMLPDGPLLFFDLLCLNLFVSAVRGDHGWTWYVFGLALGLALLGKLMALVTIAALAAFLAATPPYRFWLKRKEPYLSLLLAIAVASPFLWWNSVHHSASFKMQLWYRHASDFGLSGQKFLEYGLEQLANTTPLLVVGLLGCLLIRQRHVPADWRTPYRLVRYHSLAFLAFFGAAALVTETHPHWTVLAYPTAAVALAAIFRSPSRHPVTWKLGPLVGWTHGLLIAASCVAVVALPVAMHIDPDFLGGSLGRGLVKGRQRLLGYPDLRTRLTEIIEEEFPGGDAALFARDYRMAAKLSFDRGGEPVICLTAYIRGPTRIGYGQPYYVPLDSLDGRSGVYVTTSRSDTVGRLRRYFDDVAEQPPVEQTYAGKVLGRVRVFVVRRLDAAKVRAARQ